MRQRGKVNQFGAAFCGNGRSRGSGNDSGAGGGAGESGLEIEHGLHASRIRIDALDGGRAEKFIEELLHGSASQRHAESVIGPAKQENRFRRAAAVR